MAGFVNALDVEMSNDNNTLSHTGKIICPFSYLYVTH